jgi:hypothetical protein
MEYLMPQEIISVDSQILNSIQACARKTQYSFVYDFAPYEKAEPLEKGDLMHKMLLVYYTIKGNINSNVEEMKEITGVGIKLDSPLLAGRQAGLYYATQMNIPAETAEEVMYQFGEYVNYYSHDDWRPLAVEEVGSRVLYEDDNIKIIYNFKIDLVAEKGNVIAWFDHKTGSRREEPSSMSNQFIGYSYGLGLTHGIVNKIGFQKTLKPAERFQRYVMNYSNARIDEWIDNSVLWIKRLKENLKSNNWEMDLTSCDKYGGCIFRKVCESDPDSREWKLERDFKTVPKWDVARHLEVAK